MKSKSIKQHQDLSSAQDVKNNNLSIMAKGLTAESSDMKNILSMMEKLLHWAAIIESSDDAIISKSIEGYITSWNRGAQNLYGYTPEEIVGQPVSVLMPPEKEDDFPMIMNQLQQGKKVEHYETKRLTKDGRILDVSITVSPIRDSYGTIIGASKIARDISDRVAYERRRDEFVSTVSHELKTPITTQSIYGELLNNLVEKNADTQYKPYLTKMNKQTAKLTKLVDDLLELSRIQGGRLHLDIQQFSLDELIKDGVSDLETIAKHTFKVKGSIDNLIWGDKERVAQILLNLLSNAMKYSPVESEIVITSGIKEKDVLIGVTDSGIGIPKDLQEKVFERFFRVSGADERTYPGMGIGLNFCREIVVRHNGKIWIESELGKGTTVFFTLPLKKLVKYNPE